MKRIILKISGEALSGGSQMGISAETSSALPKKSKPFTKSVIKSVSSSAQAIFGADGMRLTTEWKERVPIIWACSGPFLMPWPFKTLWKR